MEATALAQEMRRRLGKRNKAAGAGYELKVAKKISSYCGISDWSEAFIRTKPSKSQYDPRLDEQVAVRVAGAQRAGDIMPIKDMATLWYHNPTLGPIECKYTEEWAFGTLLTTPEKSVVYRYWKESNLNTGSLRTILCFSRPRGVDLVLSTMDVSPILYDALYPILCFHAEGVNLRVTTLETFLRLVFPEFNHSE